MVKRNLFLFALVSVALLLFAGCVEGEKLTDVDGGVEDDADVEEDGGSDTFTVARAVDAEIIDPNNATAEGDIDIIYHLFDGLVRFKNEQLEVEPALATEWSVSDDELTWTFQLRDDVEFHDGTPFNADAVVQSFMRIIDEDHEFHGMIQGSYSYLDYLMGDVLDEVVEVDEYVVEFKLNQKFAPFLTYMGYYSQFIVSPTALEEKGEDFLNHPVGTGPFVFDTWQKGEYVKLSKNENYWGDVPEIDSVIFKVVPEPSTRLMELQAGSVDAIKAIDPDQVDSLNTEDITMESNTGSNLFFLALNTEAEPFDNKDVRKAVNHAINKKDLVDHVYKDNGTVATNFLPPNVFSFDESVDYYEYDVEKAKQLLADAGYEDEIEIELYAFNNARSYVSKPLQAAELIAADLNEVGINAKIITNEWASHAVIMDNSEHQAALTGWFDIGYPSNFLKSLALEASRTNFESEELQNVALEALATYDEVEQKELYSILQHELNDEAIVVPLAHNNYSIAYRNNVQGFAVDNLGVIKAHNVKVE